MENTFQLNSEWLQWLDENHPDHGLQLNDTVTISITPVPDATTADGPGPRPGDKNKPKNP